ncbi:hypothetical protein JIG36_28300 [Actinoplanes sp. LDG1-06]|uniref:Uncharacterized protein n=1 Tax=Paractinoplanes ovalisporus TaxID=2810368 RepID=A0ABS2AI13_9ACTN|nr:hypothetical protein [Actinoplanes ovalisporus]MBM2619462.1 hypothetical protein [Actinoplanes ovalisporus]
MTQATVAGPSTGPATEELDPILVHIELVRHALMDDVLLTGRPLWLWTEAAVWALVAGVGGYTWFWRGEKDYGRG